MEIKEPWTINDILERIAVDIASISIDCMRNPVVWGPLLTQYKTLYREYQCDLNNQHLQQQQVEQSQQSSGTLTIAQGLQGISPDISTVD